MQVVHSTTLQTELGGPISDPVSGDANGSMMIFELESVAAVRAELAKDPYWINDVVRLIDFSPYSLLLTVVCAV